MGGGLQRGASHLFFSGMEGCLWMNEMSMDGRLRRRVNEGMKDGWKKESTSKHAASIKGESCELNLFAFFSASSSSSPSLK